MSTLLSSAGFKVTGIDIDAEAIAREYGVYSVDWGSLEAERGDSGMRSRVWAALSSESNLRFLEFEGRQLPFPDSSTKAVLMHGVYKHIEPSLLDISLNEIRRVIEKGGYLFIMRTPRKKSYIERLFRILGITSYAHRTLYSEDDVIVRVASHGFTLVDCSFTDMLPAFPPFGLSLYNAVSGPLIALDRMLLKTPLSRYAHHMSLVFERA
jgi:SAM-dependent methyltransferase